jgi:hypothetical protein
MNRTEQLIAQLVDLEARKADLDDLITQTKAALIADRQPGDTITYGGAPVYKVSQRRTFDAKIAADTLPPDVAAAATVAKIDGTALKRLSPALWETCCTLSEPYLAKARA